MSHQYDMFECRVWYDPLQIIFLVDNMLSLPLSLQATVPSLTVSQSKHPYLTSDKLPVMASLYNSVDSTVHLCSNLRFLSLHNEL